MNQTLLYGDCLTLLPTLAPGSVDLVCADLPFAVTHNHWDTLIPFAPLWAELLRVGSPACVYVLHATAPFSAKVMASQPDLFRYELIWAKTAGTGFASANQRPMAAHEGMYVFSRATANPMSKLRMTYNPQKTPGAPYRQASGRPSKSWGTGMDKAAVTDNKTGERHPLSVWTIPTERGRLHPTQKPLRLIERLVLTYSNPGDTVLDPTAGSFTTGVACVNTGRRFIGMEKDAAYFKAGGMRLAAAHRREDVASC